MRGVVQKYAGKTEKNVAENLVMPDFCLNTHTHTLSRTPAPPLCL